jgi:hypothetical protein
MVKARLQGKAGNYRFRGAVWELGSFAYRASVHLIPVRVRPDLSRSVFSADGMTMQEVLAAAKARVKSTVGTPVETFELSFPGMGSIQSWYIPLSRRYPPLTD